MRTLIIHNHRSGFGSDAIFEFERSLVEAGHECTLRVPREDFLAADVVSDAERYDLVVISGGDGTVASILYELRGRDVLTLVFPSGTANLFAANIGNGIEPAALAAAARGMRYARTDLGELTWSDASGERHRAGFALMAGSGYDADLMQSAQADKQAIGEAAYFLAALANPKPTVARFKVDVDGEVHEREGIACILANNAMIQGDIEIIPNCSMADGLLDVMILETTEAVGLMGTVLAGVLDPAGKSLGRPSITVFRGKRIHVESSVPIPMQIDGDVVESAVSSYDARILEGVNKLVVDPLSKYAEISQKD